jgi:hypothetical protein
MTDCTRQTLLFQSLRKESGGAREVVSSFGGGAISSDAGGLLLREVDLRFGIIDRFARCFTDHRHPNMIEHTVRELVAQRLYGLALGYEDLLDHDTLRMDPLLAVLTGKADPTGRNRRRNDDKGKALAGKSTLNRLELTPAEATAKDRYKKIVADISAIEAAFVDLFVASHNKPPARIVLDIDATDDPLHGKQEGRFFHGYYRSYCYLPLYIFCGDALLAARLRPSDRDAADGTLEEVERIVTHLRRHWPHTEIVLRGDSGFCRNAIMSWCEANAVHYVFGLAKNARLKRAIHKQLKKAAKRYVKTGRAARVFRDFRYRTQKSWSKKRRVIGKAEHLVKGANPRFVVTSYGRDRFDAQTLYEQEYCARGEMENRIKEQQLYLFADRTSTAELRANQLRLYWSAMAYTLLETLRRVGLRGTEMAKAQCHTIRLRLMKIGALVRISVRRVAVWMASHYPYQALFARVMANLQRAGPTALHAH